MSRVTTVTCHVSPGSLVGVCAGPGAVPVRPLQLRPVLRVLRVTRPPQVLGRPRPGPRLQVLGGPRPPGLQGQGRHGRQQQQPQTQPRPCKVEVSNIFLWSRLDAEMQVQKSVPPITIINA